MRVSVVRRIVFSRNWMGSASAKFHALIVAGCAFVVAMFLCGLFSIDHMSNAVTSRAEARSFAPIADGEDVGFERTVMYDVVPDGRGITVVLLRLTQQSNTLPGLPAQPKIGWYVSPELQRLARMDHVVANRFPVAQEIAKDGIARADELLAYRIVSNDLPLNEQLSTRRADFFGDAGEVDRLALIIVALLLFLPSGLLLRAALSLNAQSIRRRDGLLHVLGVSHGSVRWIRFFEGAVQTLPGSIAAIALWGLIAPTITQVPLVARPVLRGDLTIGWGEMVIILCLLTVASGLLAVSFQRTWQYSRPAERVPARPSATGAFFVVAGLTTSVFAAWLTESELRPRLIVTGIFIALVSLPWALPLVLFESGKRLAVSQVRPLFTLVGRSISFRSRSFSLGMTGLVLLIAIGPVIASWIGVARKQDSIVAVPVLVEAEGLDPTFALSFSNPETAILFISKVDSGQDAQVFAECSALKHLDLVETCSIGQQIRVPQLRRREMITPVADINTFVLNVDPADVGGFLFVSRDRNIEYQLRTHALNSESTDVRLYTNMAKFESVLVAWILGAIRVGLALIALAILLSVAGQVTDTALSRQRLGALGLTITETRRIARTEAAVTYFVAGITGALISAVTLGIYLVVEQSSSLPIHTLVLALLAIFVTICVAMWQAHVQTLDPLEVWTEHASSGW